MSRERKKKKAFSSPLFFIKTKKIEKKTMASRPVSFAAAFIAVALIFSLAPIQQASAEAIPSELCGWPFISQYDFESGLFTPATMRFAQHLLCGVMGMQNCTADGTFSARTVQLIKRFQIGAKLEADGVLGPQTWQKLFAEATPLEVGRSKGQSVLALQDALNSANFTTKLTGEFDGQTVVSLRSFQVARRAAILSGKEASVDTLHLLLTGCNHSGYFWIDVGWPQGVVDAEKMKCLSKYFSFMTHECWVEAGAQGQFWPDCVGNIANAWKSGFASVGVYMFAQRFYDPKPQVEWLVGNLTSHKVRFDSIMLDIEGGKWEKYSLEQNRVFITTLRESLEAHGIKKIIIYCGREWPKYFGEDFTSFSDLPVVYAHYDQIPAFSDFRSYGGWKKPGGKQFWDGTAAVEVCGVNLDWDWAQEKFW